MKIGIIQSFPITADFSGNLRHIVQGYRECLDHGAQLVVAPATALCGLTPKDLIGRRSFISQTNAALATLSEEISEVPLLLGAYAPLAPAEVECWIQEVPDFSQTPQERTGATSPALSIVPFLLTTNSVTELEDAGTFDLFGQRFYVDIYDREIVLSEEQQADIIIHLSTTAWYRNAGTQEKDNHLWEAKRNQAVVICCRAVGTCDGALFGGGSGIVTPSGETLLRLPFFKEENRVVNIGLHPAACSKSAVQLEDDELMSALVRGIRDTAMNNGFTRLCLPLDHDNSALLALLCVKAMGADNVFGVSFEHNSLPVANSGIHTVCVHLGDMMAAAPRELDQTAQPTFEARLQGNFLSTYAEQNCCLLLSPLDRHNIMTGAFTLYGDTAGMLLPLGDLYEADICRLSSRLQREYPNVIREQQPKQRDEKLDAIIHELASMNTSPTMLISFAGQLYSENEVRLVQRRMSATALSRKQLPPTLRVLPGSQQLDIPTAHRLND